MDISQKPIFNVCHLAPLFIDLAELIHNGLTELGLTSFLNQSTIINEAQNIIFGAHLIPDWNIVPPGSIIFNLEQLTSGSPYCSAFYFDCLRRHPVWDYSPRNIAHLRDNNINSNPTLIPIGFSPSVYRIKKAEIQDIDVLFYGAINERRQKILDDLKRAGLRVVNLLGVYGPQLDEYIARSKTVLNLHFHASKIFEVVRVSYLLNNRKAVVSEVGADTEIDPEIRAAIVGAEYEQLVDELIRLVRDDELRSLQEDRGYAVFSRHTQAEYLRKVLFTEQSQPTSMPK